MKTPISHDKSKDFLKKIGQTLHQQRTIVSRKELPEFSELISLFSGLTYTPEIINDMEGGEKSIPIIYWIHIWQYFQNLDRILMAYDAKDMMYLAQQEFLPDIEKEILAHHNQKTNNEK